LAITKERTPALSPDSGLRADQSVINKVRGTSVERLFKLSAAADLAAFCHKAGSTVEVELAGALTD